MRLIIEGRFTPMAIMNNKKFVLVFQTKESDEFYDFFYSEEAAKEALRTIIGNEDYNHVALFKIEKEIKL